MRRFIRWLLKWLFRGMLVALLLCVALSLPLRWIDPPGSAFMLIDRVSHQRVPEHQWVALDDISPHLALAVIAAEDQNFPHHRGFDLVQIRDAVSSRLDGGRLRGASTLSQQLSRNLYLWPDRSWVRKGLEFVMTVPLEVFLPKHRILELYLNLAEWDDGVFGAEAAARHHFGKVAANLTRSEAVALAAVLPAPGALDPNDPNDWQRAREDWISQQMSNLGFGWLSFINPSD